MLIRSGRNSQASDVETGIAVIEWCGRRAAQVVVHFGHRGQHLNRDQALSWYSAKVSHRPGAFPPGGGKHPEQVSVGRGPMSSLGIGERASAPVLESASPALAAEAVRFRGTWGFGAATTSRGFGTKRRCS